MKYRGFVIKTDWFGSDYKNDYKKAYKRMSRNSVRSVITWRVTVRFLTRWSCRGGTLTKPQDADSYCFVWIWNGRWTLPATSRNGHKKTQPLRRYA